MESSKSSDSQSLRLMRFRFTPNQSLIDSIKSHMVPADDMEPLRFYGSRQLVISGEDALRHTADLNAVGERFVASSVLVRPLSSLRASLIEGTSLTRIQLRPSDQASFDDTTSLEVDPDSRSGYPHDLMLDVYNRLPRGISALPNRLSDQPKSGHYVFVDVATDSLVSARQGRIESTEFIVSAAAGRHWLRPLRHEIVRYVRTTPR